MRKKSLHIARKGLDFLVLGVVLFGGFWGMLFFQHQTQTQLIILLLLSLWYVFWGATHHFHRGDLTINIVFEYVIVSIIGFLLLGGLLIK